MDLHNDLSCTDLIKILSKEIIQKDSVFFCGAGVSLNSGLPIIYGSKYKKNKTVYYSGIADNILQQLGMNEVEIDIIKNSNIPFEFIIESLAKETNINKILEIFQLGEPNTNHFLIAKLAKKGYLKTICTTNFDILIEKAFLKEGLVENKHYEVIYKEKDYENIDWDNKKIRLIKIHGSIEDKKNMAITIRRIANKENNQKRQEAIKHIFSKGHHKSVIILGYSCSDIFDITPCIESIGKNGKNIFHIEHCHKDAKKGNAFYKIEDIKNKKEKNPFKKLHGKRLFIDTNEFAKNVWQQCLKEDYFFRQYNNIESSWKSLVVEWSLTAKDKSDMELKYHLAAQLFWEINVYKLAIKYWEKALQLSKDIADKYSICCHIGNIGIAYRDLGHYEKAIEYFNRSLKLAKQCNSRVVERRQVSNLGGTYRIIGNPDKAIKYHNKALKIAEDLGKKKEKGISLGNLGICYDSIGNYNKAITYYKRSIQIARSVGDKKGEGKRIGNLGITYHKLSKYKLSINYHHKALSILKNIGDRLGEGNTYNDFGMVYMSMRNYKKATKYFKQALSILNVLLGVNHQYTIEAEQNLKLAQYNLSTQKKEN